MVVTVKKQNQNNELMIKSIKNYVIKYITFYCLYIVFWRQYANQFFMEK